MIYGQVRATRGEDTNTFRGQRVRGGGGRRGRVGREERPPAPELRLPLPGTRRRRAGSSAVPVAASGQRVTWTCPICVRLFQKDNSCVFCIIMVVLSDLLTSRLPAFFFSLTLE